MFDKVSAIHFEKWFGQNLYELLDKMKNKKIDEDVRANLAVKVIKPFALRQVKIQSKALRIYKNERVSETDIQVKAVCLSVAMITGKSYAQSVEDLLEYAKHAAKKTS